MANLNQDRLYSTQDLGVDFKTRRIYLFGSVEPEMALRAITALHQLEEKPGDITVFLNSDGGDEYAGWAIYDAFKAAKNRIIVIGMGQVMSMAAILLQMASLGCRGLTANTRFMIHDGAQKVGEGKSAAHSSVVIAAGKEQEINNRRYAARLAVASGMSLQKVQELSLRETYLSAREAVDLGFADNYIHATGAVK